MLSFGKNVCRDKAKFEIESPVATETNLAIKAVEQTEQGIHRCYPSGETYFRDKAKFEIESPVATENNLAIKAVEQTDQGIYRCYLSGETYFEIRRKFEIINCIKKIILATPIPGLKLQNIYHPNI